MGDLKKDDIITKIKDRETRIIEKNIKTIDKISGNSKTKDHQTSLRVNSVTYEKFKKICAARGISTNAAICMLISDFVIKYKDIIED